MTLGGQDLAKLAALHGIHTSYTDVDGVGRQADPTVIFALLQALGVPLEHPEDAAALRRDQEIGALRRQLEPVVVYRMGRGEPISATLPDGTEPGSVWLTLELEDGTTSRCQLASAVTRFTTDEGIGGNRYARVQFDLDAVAMRPVPPGYHRLTLEGAGSPESALVLAAPECPDGPRAWGAFVPLHALRAEQDSGIGTYSDLARLGDWVASLGGGLVGTLPLYPAFPGPPFDPSPYLPASRLAYNELFIDPFVLPEYEGAPAHTPAPAEGQLSGPPSASPMVDYEEIARLRRQQLEPLARAVCSGAFPDRRQRFEEFATAHPELVAYAEYRASQEGAARAPDVRTPVQCATTSTPSGWRPSNWARRAIAGVAMRTFRWDPIPGGSIPSGHPNPSSRACRGDPHPTASLPEGRAGGSAPFIRSAYEKTDTASSPLRCDAPSCTPIASASTTSWASNGCT